MHAQGYGVISTGMHRVGSRLPLMWRSSGLPYEGQSMYTLGNRSNRSVDQVRRVHKGQYRDICNALEWTFLCKSL